MKRLFKIFELSKNEQRVVLIIMLILITVALRRLRVPRSSSSRCVGISNNNRNQSLDCCGNEWRSD